MERMVMMNRNPREHIKKPMAPYKTICNLKYKEKWG